MKESAIQTTIETQLRYYENLGKLVYIKNNSGAFQTKKGGYYRFGKKGSPDFLIFLKNGATIHLEIKQGKNKQQSSQKEYQAKVEALGHVYKVIYSVAELDTIFG